METTFFSVESGLNIKKSNRKIALAFLIGAAIGVAIGLATDNLAVWIGVGSGLGVAIGAALSRNNE